MVSFMAGKQKRERINVDVSDTIVKRALALRAAELQAKWRRPVSMTEAAEEILRAGLSREIQQILREEGQDSSPPPEPRRKRGRPKKGGDD